jgi:hypothetical protein
MFWKLALLLSSGERIKPNLLGPLDKDNLNPEYSKSVDRQRITIFIQIQYHMPQNKTCIPIFIAF